jgi:4-hydroxybenzoate polyprenyltransferase
VTTIEAWLRLARLSNLPTIWSNVLAASALAGYADWRGVLVVTAAMSLLYTGGMVLNDVFDRRIDKEERPERPLPAGLVSTGAALVAGGGLIASGVGLLATVCMEAAAAGLALAALILLYDAWHKGNPLAPLVMGACRGMVYVTTAVAAGAWPAEVLVVAAASLFLYVSALTYAAKAEAFDRVGSLLPLPLIFAPSLAALWIAPRDPFTIVMVLAAGICLLMAVSCLKRRAPGDVGRAVGMLIASIALGDAGLSSAAGAPLLAAACCLCFALTWLLQRTIPGT